MLGVITDKYSVEKKGRKEKPKTPALQTYIEGRVHLSLEPQALTTLTTYKMYNVDFTTRHNAALALVNRSVKHLC